MNTDTPNKRRFALGPVGAGLLLTMTFAVALPLFVYFGFQTHRNSGVAAAFIAAGICWGAGLLALSVFAILRDPQQVINAVGLSMMIRMGIPMLAGIFLTKTGGPLVEAGVFGMIVGFYLIGLIVETLLVISLTTTRKQEQVSKAL